MTVSFWYKFGSRPIIYLCGRFGILAPGWQRPRFTMVEKVPPSKVQNRGKAYRGNRTPQGTLDLTNRRLISNEAEAAMWPGG
jgi:hypothetical protein